MLNAITPETICIAYKDTDGYLSILKFTKEEEKEEYLEKAKAELDVDINRYKDLASISTPIAHLIKRLKHVRENLFFITVKEFMEADNGYQKD